MKYSDDDLAGYLSGDCTEQVMRDIETARENDPVLGARIDAFISQDHEIKAAFDRLLDAPANVSLPNAQEQEHRPTQSAFWQRCAAALALLLVGGLIGGAITSRQATTPAVASTPWYVPVAEYQALYGRPTLAQPDATDREREATRTRLSEMSDINVSIPPLSDFGLAFKRGQYLEADSEPLVQLAYLPDSGKPFAFCFMRQAGVDTRVETATHAGMNLRHWRTDGVAYVLVGDFDDARMDAITAHVRSL